MKDGPRWPRIEMRELLRSRKALVVGVALLAAMAPTATRAVRSPSSVLGLQRAAGPGRATPGNGSPVAKPTAGVADRNRLRNPGVVSKPNVLHLTKAHGAVFDVRGLKSTVVKQERPEDRAPGENPATEQPSRVAPSVLKRAAISTPAPAPDSSFDGLDFATWGAGHPPDTNGDVGPTYYIQTINTSIGIYDKSNGNRVAAFTFNAFMSQGHFGNLCDTNNFGDPVVLYDSFEDRWFITDFAFALDGSGNVNPQTVFQCFAVSKTGDPVAAAGTSTRSRRRAASTTIRSSASGRTASTCRPTCSATRRAPRTSRPHVWALDKAQMYAGEPSRRRWSTSPVRRPTSR